MVNGIGLPPSGNGKLLRGFFPMRQFKTSDRNIGQEGRYTQLINLLNARHGISGAELQKLPPAQLKDFIADEIRQLYIPKTVDFNEQGILAEEKKIALDQARTIYIPNRNAAKLYVSGNTPMDSIAIYEVEAEQLGLDPAKLPAGHESAIISPLISGLGKEVPLAEYPRRGILTVTFDRINALDPQVDTIIFRMIALDMAVALHRNNQTL
jgi:hypothetical protein